MSFFIRRQKETFFITKNFTDMITSKCNLILSPEFYWAKRVTLNVSFAYEVKKMAPSLFDGILPDGDFEYLVFKISKGNFIVIAFSTTYIMEELKKLGIDMDLVSKVYTLDSEFLGCELSLCIDDNFGVVSLDGVMVYTPLEFIETHRTLKDALKDKKLTKHHIYTKEFQKFKIEPKHLNMVLWILFISFSILVINTIKTQKISNELSSQKKRFIEKHHLPQTSFQLKSIQSELESIDKIQLDLRKSIYYINKFKLNKEEFVSHISFLKNKLNCSLKLDNKKREKEFDKYLLKQPKSTILVGARYE